MLRVCAALLGAPLWLMSQVYADEVKILDVKFNKKGIGWTVSVKLQHADEGWRHYADVWRIVDAQNTIFGERILRHPHVNEQPFTRSLTQVIIPLDVPVVYIEAHDSVHGWSAPRLKVDLRRKEGVRYRVQR